MRPNEEVAHGLAPFHTFTRVYPTPGDARAAIGTAAPRWTHALMMPTPLAASRAHSLVGDACVRWQLPQLLHPAPVVVSEIAGNAIEHASTAFDATASGKIDAAVAALRAGALAQLQHEGEAYRYA